MYEDVGSSYAICANCNCQITPSQHINTRGWARFLSRHMYGSLLDIYSNYYSSSPSCYVPNEFFMHTSPRASVISLWVCSTPTKMSLFMLIFFFQHVYGLMTLGVAPQPSRYWTCKYLSTIICSWNTFLPSAQILWVYTCVFFCLRKLKKSSPKIQHYSV